MSLLLDAHVWVWTQVQPADLGGKCRTLLETTAEPLCVSAVSSLEIGRLVAGGLLELEGRLDRWVRTALESLQA